MDIKIDIKAEIENIFNTYIKREGSQNLFNYLLKTDYFTAPASSRFHGAERGGLAKHSLLVYKRLLTLIKNEYGEKYTERYSDESIAICSLLHDLCKINYYKVDYRNVKVNGEWVKTPYYAVEDTFPFGHGEKSVFIINNFIKLSPEEAMAINWHMGGFDDRIKSNSKIIGEAFNKYELAVFLHTADLLSTYIDEKNK